MKFLLDTCLLAELVKKQPEPKILAWLDARKEHEIHVAAITMAELHRGVARLSPSRRKSELAGWLAQLQTGFVDRILPFTAETAGYWAEMCAGAEARGRSLAAFDSIIAATAAEHGLALVTRNERRFVDVPVVVINPWQID